MDVTASMVNALRQKTGLSMMECKKALVEGQGDESKAIEILKKRGLSKQADMTGRAAGEGRIACFVSPTGGGICELRCETAPVANTDDFIACAKLVAQAAAGMANPTPEAVAAAASPRGGRTIADEIADVFNRLREKMEIARVAALSGSVGHYVHHNGQVGVLLQLSGPCPAEASAGVCMHIAAMRPPYLTRAEVPAAMVEEQRTAARAAAAGKPANIVEKIVEGKLNTWYGEVVLLDQPFVKVEGKQTVQEYLDGVQKGLTVVKALRYEVGKA
ncbi:MAG: translation elongation factor Ts [Planctomycetia bacterium]|nr:MAG: translation elongation factor Ts [Planctomycetia bacterium]